MSPRTVEVAKRGNIDGDRIRVARIHGNDPSCSHKPTIVGLVSECSFKCCGIVLGHGHHHVPVHDIDASRIHVLDLNHDLGLHLDRGMHSFQNPIRFGSLKNALLINQLSIAEVIDVVSLDLDQALPIRQNATAQTKNGTPNTVMIRVVTTPPPLPPAPISTTKRTSKTVDASATASATVNDRRPIHVSKATAKRSERHCSYRRCRHVTVTNTSTRLQLMQSTHSIPSNTIHRIRKLAINMVEKRSVIMTIANRMVMVCDILVL